MCIAIVKPIGAKLPDKELLRKCWDNNPDGGGLMYNDGSNVIIHKGFTRFKGFYKYLKQLDKQVDLTDKDLVLHFRIATSGGVTREATHPFPVTKSMEEMRKLDNVCEYGFAHNGIISGYGSKDFSDTMEYIQAVIANIHDLENSEELLNALAYDNTSRFAVLTKDNFELGGKWLKDGDLYFSNESYKYNYTIYKGGKATTSTTSYWDNWKDEDWKELGWKKCAFCGEWYRDNECVKLGEGEEDYCCKWCFEEVMEDVRLQEEEKKKAELEEIF